MNELRVGAISEACYKISKWNNIYNLNMSEEEIWNASLWNWRTFGYGYINLDEYFEYKKNKLTKRLYNINVKEWYRILKTIFIRDNYTCFYCGKKGGKLEGDHKIPISKGGTNELSNLTTSCRKCNRQKKDKSIEEFLIWKFNNNG